MKVVTAHVKSPENGIRFTHDFEGGSVQEVLFNMAAGLDLENADRVDIAITSEPVVEGTAVEVWGHPADPEVLQHPDGPRAFGA